MSDNAYTAVLDSIDEECLQHHGILGMKWGIRRYQNPDGTLTALGKKHLDDGKTQAAIDKWNQKKSNAMAKGNQKFAKKNIDYLSNEEIDKFKTRIKARTSLDDLKQESRKITEEKLRSWSNMMNSVSNAGQSAVNIYNTFAKVNNSLFGGKMKLIKDSEGVKEGIQEINETFKNGVLETRTTRSQDANGVKTSKTENFGEDPNRDKVNFINTTYDANNNKTQEVKEYVKNGVKMKDVRNYASKESKDNGGSDDKGKGDTSGDTKPTNPSPKLPVPTGGGNSSKTKQEAPKQPKQETKQTSSSKSDKVERVDGEVIGSGNSKFKQKSNVQDAEGYIPITNRITQGSSTGTSIVPSYWVGGSSGNSSKSSGSSNTGGFKGFKNNMTPNAQKAVNDVDNYTDELFKILNGMGRI